MFKLLLRIYLLLALLPFFLLFASPVSADIFWSTPAQISTSADDATFPATATGPNGYLHTTWAEYSKTNPDISSVFYSYWNGDVWSTPLKIDQNLGWADLPWITTTGTASNYKVHLVWYEGPTWDTAVISHKEYSSATSSWSTAENITQGLDIPGACAWDPRILGDSAGNLHVTFEYQIVCNDSDTGVKLYYTKYNGSSWSTPYRLTIKGTEADRIWAASLAIDTSNNPHVILPESGSTGHDPQAGIYETYWNGSDWTVPEKLANYDFSDKMYVKLVIDGNNNRHLAYTNETLFDTTSQSYRTKVNYKKYNGSTWSSPVIISSNATISTWSNAIFGVTFDSNNNVYVGWGEKVGWSGDLSHGVQVSYKKSTDGISWSSPIFMRYVYELDSPFLYRDQWDNQHFAWTEEDEATGKWTLWYSTVPTSASVYNPSSAYTLTMKTGDTLTIPANSLATSATISAQIGPLPASADPNLTTLPRSYTFRPHGLTFIGGNKVAKANIFYTDGELINADERNLKIYVWDGTLNSGLGGWSTNFSASTNTSQNKSIVTLPHFSLYGVSAPKIQTNFASPTSTLTGPSIPVNYQLINKMTNLPADPPSARTIIVSTDEEGNDTTEAFWDEYKAELVNQNGDVLQTLSYDAGNGTLSYNTTTSIYSGQFSAGCLSEGNYTIKVYLATIEVGSFTFHFTPDPSLLTANYLPPLKGTDVYSMQDGSTLPLKVYLSQACSTSVLKDKKEIKITVDGVSNPSIHYETVPTFDPDSGTYTVLLHTQELNMGLDTYEVKVLLPENKLVEPTIQFSIIEQGKAKGKQ
ncbi:MAG: hypothetical protein Q7S03_00075 [bacterium]|nr:hypothetical protein [bacterium]